MTTPILSLTEIAESQANKYITHNEALRRIEALTVRLNSKTTSAEPVSPSAGDSYYVPAGATGTNWSGQDGSVAYYDGSVWQFVTAFEGLTFWVNDEDGLYSFDGSAWVPAGSTVPNGSVTIAKLSDFAQDTGTTTGLTFGYQAGSVRSDNTVTAVSAGTLSLTASSTNYIEVSGGGTVSFNTTGFTSGLIPLFQATTDGSSITGVTDKRSWLSTGAAGGGEANTAANVGTGDGWYKQKVSTELQFKTALAGDGVSLSAGTDEITITSNTETVHAASSGAFDRANGGIQTYTLTANETVSVTINEGQSLTLHLSGGATYTVTWPTMTWVGGSAPTLTAADVIEFWKVGTTLYGAYVGSVA